MHYETDIKTGETTIRPHTAEELAIFAAGRDSLDAIKKEGIDQVRGKMEARRGRLVSLRPGQKTEEEFKREEGRTWAAELKPDPPARGDYPIAEAEAAEEGVTVAVRLQSYLDDEASLKTALAEIAGLERRAVRAIERAADEEAVSGIVEGM